MVDFQGHVGPGQRPTGDPLQARLEALTEEFAKGQAGLRELERQERALRETLLQISGAIQVLQELMREGRAPADGLAGMPASQPPPAYRIPGLIAPGEGAPGGRDGLGQD